MIKFYLFNIAKKRKWNNVVIKVCFKLQDPCRKLSNWKVKKFKIEAKQFIVNEMNFNKLSVTYWWGSYTCVLPLVLHTISWFSFCLFGCPIFGLKEVTWFLRSDFSRSLEQSECLIALESNLLTSGWALSEGEITRELAALNLAPY